MNFNKITEIGCKYRIVSTEHVAELGQEIEKQIKQGQFSQQFIERYLLKHDYKMPYALSEARSLIVIAIPRQINKAVFNWNGKKQTVLLPPIYAINDETRFMVEHEVIDALDEKGYSAVTARLPLKLLAVRSGLAQYGQNNIAYVDGMGSFLSLTALFSDMPVEKDHWQEAKIMAACSKCGLCKKACPTGAICVDKFMINTEKCITEHSERDAKISFPDWVKPEWHNCLVGCIRCQAACPQNRPYFKQIGKIVEFSEQETRLLLTAPKHLSQETIAKIRSLSLLDYIERFPRNLKALLH